jgi:hypothetical protein
MGKCIWLAGGLAFLGTLAIVHRQQSVDRTAAAEGRTASVSSPGVTGGESVQGRYERDAIRAHQAGSQPAGPAIFNGSAIPDASPQLRSSAKLVGIRLPQRSTSGQTPAGAAHPPGEVDPRLEEAARLPQSVWERLKDSDEPTEQELFQRNSELSTPGTQDDWGNAMQEELTQFFAAQSFATRPEAAGAQIVVACREIQCQIQVTAPLPATMGAEAQSELVINDLRRQPWYQAELAMTVGEATVNNGKLYQLQYFDRK